MPKGKKHSPEQIIAVLRRAEGGKSVSELCRDVNISEATFYRWQRQYGAGETGSTALHLTDCIWRAFWLG